MTYQTGNVSATADAKVELRAADRPKTELYRTVRGVERARQTLGLSHSACAYLRLAADHVSGADLADGRKPVFFLRVDDAAHMLGVSPRQINNIERRLAEAGFIKRETLGNGHRHARRNPRTGETLWAHGVSLTPLIDRADEIAALATKLEDDDRAFRAARQQINRARARLATALQSADGEAAEEGRAVLAAAPLRIRRSVTTAMLNRITAGLALAADALESHTVESVDNTPETLKTSDEPEGKCRHINNTSPSLLDSCSRREKQARRPSPQDILHIAPKRWRIGMAGDQTADWTDIGYIAKARRKELRVSATAWRDGMEIMGPARAMMTLAILDANRTHPKHPVRNVGGAFVAMTRREREGRLDLDTSIQYLLARRNARQVTA